MKSRYFSFKLSRLAPLSLLAALAVGCGGSGGGGGTPTSPGSVSGRFAGWWKCADGSSGTCNLLVQTTGNVSGTIVNNAQSTVQGNFIGQLNGAQVSGWYLFPGETTVNYTGTASVSKTTPYVLSMNFTSMENAADTYTCVFTQQPNL